VSIISNFLLIALHATIKLSVAAH